MCLFPYLIQIKNKLGEPPFVILCVVFFLNVDMQVVYWIAAWEKNLEIRVRNPVMQTSLVICLYLSPIFIGQIVGIYLENVFFLKMFVMQYSLAK